MNQYSIEELCACARRELALRRRVYRRLVESGRMKQETAVREVAMMEAIAELLESQQQPKLF